jgi:hypothetical protein
MTHQQVLKTLGLDYDCMMSRAIKSLSSAQVKELSERVDLQNDYLIHVDPDGFTVNHGNVGSRGISYEFWARPERYFQFDVAGWLNTQYVKAESQEVAYAEAIHVAAGESNLRRFGVLEGRELEEAIADQFGGCLHTPYVLA